MSVIAVEATCPACGQDSTFEQADLADDGRTVTCDHCGADFALEDRSLDMFQVFADMPSMAELVRELEPGEEPQSEEEMVSAIEQMIREAAEKAGLEGATIERVDRGAAQNESPTTPEAAEEIVRLAEAVYRRRDVEETMALYTDDAVIVWNGKEVARGADEIRAFHEKFYDPVTQNVKLDKTLIAASGDWIAVEWTASWDNADGSKGAQVAGEHWKMRGDQLCEWRAFVSTRRVD